MESHSCKCIRLIHTLLSMCSRRILLSHNRNPREFFHRQLDETRTEPGKDRPSLPRKHATTTRLRLWRNPGPFAHSRIYTLVFAADGFFASMTPAARSLAWTGWVGVYPNPKTPNASSPFTEDRVPPFQSWNIWSLSRTKISRLLLLSLSYRESHVRLGFPFAEGWEIDVTRKLPRHKRRGIVVLIS